MSPRCDFDLENSKSIFLHDTPTHNDASHYQVWKQNVWQFRRYSLVILDEHSLKFWIFSVTLTVNVAIHFFSKDALAYDDVSSDQFWLPKKISCSEEIVVLERVLFWSDEPLLWPSDSKHFFSSMTLQLTMLHYQIWRQNVLWFRRYPLDKHSLRFWNRCNLDLEWSTPIFSQETLAYDAVLPNQVWLQTSQQFARYSRNSHILII